jgi:hypothetical protein
MGNSVSQENQSDIMQNGGGFSNNFNDLQNTIQQMVKKSNNSTYSETINLHDSSSDIDFESIQEVRQSGGLADILNVAPRRIRYGKIPVEPSISHFGGAERGNLKDLESINENDLEILKNILSKHANQSGGCGCSGDAGERIVSDTSPQPIDYEMLSGGAKKKESKDDETSETEETEEDIESEDEEESEEVEEEEEEDEDEEEGDPLARTKNDSSSSSSSSSSNNKKLKRAKKHSDSEYLKTSQSGGSEEIVIDSKYLYSDNNSFYGSDDNSEYYKAIKNRSVL